MARLVVVSNRVTVPKSKRERPRRRPRGRDPPGLKAALRRLVRMEWQGYRRTALVIGVDRLDYSKGIALRMEAFDRFLSTHPEWRGKVTYLQITPKSRSEIREYADMERQIDETAGRINGMYGEAS